MSFPRYRPPRDTLDAKLGRLLSQLDAIATVMETMGLSSISDAAARDGERQLARIARALHKAKRRCAV